jgi:hypothetical protein
MTGEPVYEWQPVHEWQPDGDGDGAAGPRPAIGGMSWVAWRQSRAALTGVAGVLALFTAMAFWERANPHLAGLTESFSLNLYLILALLLGTPLLAREYDAGTHQLAWTQSVPRAQWLTARLAVNLGIGLLATGVLHLIINVVIIGGQHGSPAGIPLELTSHGLLPYAQALCAIAWGVACGALLGRLLPALGVTLVGVFAQGLFVTTGLGTAPASVAFWSEQLSRAAALVALGAVLIALTYRATVRK